jgi:hypothetical protein
MSNRRNKWPRWNAAVHTLFLGGRHVKHYKLAAPNQEPILAAFEAAHWRQTIEFHFEHGQRGNGKVKLRNAIHDLNRSVRPYLHFFQEGSGARIGWRLVKTKRRQP